MLNDKPTDFISCYRILGLAATERNWERVRASYRRLVSNWHPDKISSVNLSLAEERTKEINSAYHTLAAYYRLHGHLPSPVESNFDETPEPQDANEVATNLYQNGNGPTATPAPAVTVSNQRSSFLSSSAGRISLLLAFGYIVFHLTNFIEIAPDPKSASAPTRVSSTLDSQSSAPVKVGATLGDVVSVLGTPIRVENNVWFYDTARVTFHDGHVVSYEQTTQTSPSSNSTDSIGVLQKEFFGIGSTRSNVRAIQGPPDHMEEGTWQYGASRVFFSGDHVISWDEHPLSPLRIRR